jgi:hypothetical protein
MSGVWIEEPTLKRHTPSILECMIQNCYLSRLTSQHFFGGPGGGEVGYMTI